MKCTPYDFTKSSIYGPETVANIEHFYGEINRRSDVAGIFSNAGAIFRRVAALLSDRNDKWAARRSRGTSGRVANIKR